MKFLALTAACFAIACTPQEAKTIEKDAIDGARAACVVENAFKIVDDDALLAFCGALAQEKPAGRKIAASARRIGK